MKRDMELIRRILLDVSSRKDAEGRAVRLEGVDQLVVDRHLEMLHAAGLIDIQGRICYSKWSPAQEPIKIHVKDLSMAGHDFLRALGNESVWSRIKGAYSADQLAIQPLGVIKMLAAAVLIVWAQNQIGS